MPTIHVMRQFIGGVPKWIFRQILVSKLLETTLDTFQTIFSGVFGTVDYKNDVNFRVRQKNRHFSKQPVYRFLTF